MSSDERLARMKESFDAAVEEFRNNRDSPEEWLKKESQKPVKDCPFCGSKGHLIDIYAHRGFVYRYEYVCCSNLDCGMRVARMMYSQWNKRA